MSPQEFWLIADARKPPRMVGAMRGDVFDELQAMLHESEVDKCQA